MKPGDLEMRLEGYLGLRRAVGFAMKAEERLLRDFIAFLDRYGLDGAVQARDAIEWVTSTQERCGARRQARRLSVARGFLVHLRTAVPETQVPAYGLLASPLRPTPHIYSEAEIDALMTAARSLGPVGTLRPHTYVTVIGLLVSCGLRIGEAIRLRREYVDLQAQLPQLRITETKFRKTRVVPLHPSTARALIDYAEARRRFGHDGRCDTFFVSERGAPLAYQTVLRTFTRLARQAGIAVLAGRRESRLHQLRHTFAVRRLLAWYRDGADVHARLPELAVYLGHVKPEDTYWYLTATPELLASAAQRFASYASSGGDQ
jgi:integrase